MCVERFEIGDILERYPKDASSLMMLLQDIQERCNYLPAEALAEVGQALSLRKSQIYAVATFYKVFSLTPKGRHMCKVCTGTACHVRGAPLVVDEATRVLGIAPGETTADGEYTLETVGCVGACAMAPVMVVDDEYHAGVKPSRVRKLLGVADAD